MRYLIIFLITLVAYSQSVPSEIPRDRKNTPAAVVMYFDESDSTYHYLRIDSLNADIITELQTLIGHVDGVESTLTAIDSNTDRNTTGGQGTQSVTTSAAALPSQSSKVVWLENQNSSGNIYWGYSSGVTTSNGMLLSPNMGVKIETDNLSDIYVIANSSLTIRYSYQN